MTTRRFILVIACIAVVVGLASSKEKPFTETGTLMEMAAVPCGSQERGFTGIGGLFATAGVEHVNAKDKLCQEYVIRTSFMQYRIRPLDEKHPVLLPVGEKAHFHIKGDHILLTVPDGDDQQREYRVVGMKPLTVGDEAGSHSLSAPAAELPRGTSFTSPGSATPQLERRPPMVPDPPPATLTPRTPSTPTVLPQANVPEGGSDPSGPASLQASVVRDASGTGGASGPHDEGGTVAASNPDSSKPLSTVQIMGLVAGGVSGHRVAKLVTERGINFRPDDKYLADLRSAGATDDVIAALRGAKQQSEVTGQSAGGVDLQVQENVTRGALLARDQKYRDAEQEYRKAEQLRPADPSVHFALGYALSQEGNWSKAADEYRAAVQSDPNNAAAHADLGIALARGGDPNAAINEYQRALSIDPNLSALHNNMGVALKEKGDLGGAQAQFRQALSESPNDAQVHTNLGSVLQQQGNLDGAVQEYRQAIGLNASCCQAEYNLATALEASGNVEGALGAFQKVVKTNPNDARAHAGLASALEKKGDSAEALLQYQTALTLAPTDPEIRAGHDALVKRIQAEATSSTATNH